MHGDEHLLVGYVGMQIVQGLSNSALPYAARLAQHTWLVGTWNRAMFHDGFDGKTNGAT
jgi:hypothetical protein